MKAINRLNEIYKISKYTKYIDNELIPKFIESTGQGFQKRFFTDDYTYVYSSLKDPDGALFSTAIRFTTNIENMGDDEEFEDDYKFNCEVVLNGIKLNAGGMTMELDYDLEILLDTYYDYFETYKNH